MLFQVSYEPRAHGTAAQNLNETRTAFQAWDTWGLPDGVEVHTFVTRLDGRGGTVLFETADAEALYGIVAKFSPWYTFDVVPVLDITRTVPIVTAALEWDGEIFAGAAAAGEG